MNLRKFLLAVLMLSGPATAFSPTTEIQDLDDDLMVGPAGAALWEYCAPTTGPCSFSFIRYPDKDNPNTSDIIFDSQCRKIGRKTKDPRSYRMIVPAECLPFSSYADLEEEHIFNASKYYGMINQNCLKWYESFQRTVIIWCPFDCSIELEDGHALTEQPRRYAVPMDMSGAGRFNVQAS
jgi:hypothetical protein